MADFIDVDQIVVVSDRLWFIFLLLLILGLMIALTPI